MNNFVRKVCKKYSDKLNHTGIQSKLTQLSCILLDYVAWVPCAQAPFKLIQLLVDERDV